MKTQSRDRRFPLDGPYPDRSAYYAEVKERRKRERAERRGERLAKEAEREVEHDALDPPIYGTGHKPGEIPLPIDEVGTAEQPGLTGAGWITSDEYVQLHGLDERRDGVQPQADLGREDAFRVINITVSPSDYARMRYARELAEDEAARARGDRDGTWSQGDVGRSR